MADDRRTPMEAKCLDDVCPRTQHRRARDYCDRAEYVVGAIKNAAGAFGRLLRDLFALVAAFVVGIAGLNAPFPSVMLVGAVVLFIGVPFMIWRILTGAWRKD